MKKKVIKAGNSTAVTVPADFVRKVGIKIGDDVEVHTDLESGCVTYTFSGVRQLAIKSSLFSTSRRKNTGQSAFRVSPSGTNLIPTSS